MDEIVDKAFSNLFKSMILHRKILLTRTINQIKEDAKFIASYDKEAMYKHMKELKFLEEYDNSLTTVYDFEFTDFS